MTDFIVFDMGILDAGISESFDNMKKAITTYKPKDVLFIGGWELTHAFFNGYLDIKDNVRTEFDIIHEFGDFLETEGVQFHLILSAFDDEIFNRFREKPVKNFNLHFWKTWCLHEMVKFMMQDGYDITNKNIETDFDKLFVCFINKGKYHRRVLIDLICENELFDNSIVTWHSQTTTFVDSKIYDFKCWQETELLFDDYYTDYPRPFLESSLKTKCLINLVTETHREGLFLSEKTWKPIITGHPFISLGAKNQNNAMKELGFELYDELFDYTFDDANTIEERANGLIKNLVKLKDEELTNLYNLVKEKVQFNKNRAKQILNESLYIPNIILDLFVKTDKKVEISELNYSNVMEFLYKYKKDKI